MQAKARTDLGPSTGGDADGDAERIRRAARRASVRGARRPRASSEVEVETETEETALETAREVDCRAATIILCDNGVRGPIAGKRVTLGDSSLCEGVAGA